VFPADISFFSSRLSDGSHDGACALAIRPDHAYQAPALQAQMTICRRMAGNPVSMSPAADLLRKYGLERPKR
jgi:hypothetical protein